MKAPIIPYKIVRTDLPGNNIVIRCRVLGFQAMGAVFILPIAVTFLLLYHPAHFIPVIALCLALLLVQPFVCRFKVAISPSFVTMRIKYFGITQTYVQVPFSSVLVDVYGYRHINEAFYEGYNRNKTGYMVLGFDNGWSDPVDYVRWNYGGKEFAMSMESAAFEKEFWNVLTAAISETYELKAK